MRAPAVRLEQDAAEHRRHADVLLATMSRARWDEEELSARKIEEAGILKLVGGGTFEQKDQLEALVRVPCDPPCAAASDAADIHHERQADVATREPLVGGSALFHSSHGYGLLSGSLTHKTEFAFVSNIART